VQFHFEQDFLSSGGMLMNRLEDIMPNFWDNDFEPLSCGIIEVWANASCDTLLKLYSSSKLGDTELQNPYHLTSAGRAKTPVYFKENGAFIVVKNKDGVPIKSYEYETSNSMQGTLNVEDDVKAGRNLESEEDTIVGRNLDVKGYALIKEDITAKNATIADTTTTKELAVSNHTETKTLKVTGKADIDVLNVLGSIAINEAKLNAIEIAKSMKFGNVNIFVGQSFEEVDIVNTATYFRCTFTKQLTLNGSVDDARFVGCVFGEDVNLTGNNYEWLHIEDCIFASGKKINLTNPACVFNSCKIRRNESLGSNPFVPLNIDMEGALFKIVAVNAGKKYTLKTNLIATDYLKNTHPWLHNFLLETITKLYGGEGILDKNVYSFSLHHVLTTAKGNQNELEVGIATLDAGVVGVYEGMNVSEIIFNYIKFIPCGIGLST
jgi:hypothetical protein